MRVHPTPKRRTMALLPSAAGQKKLRRLPHIFSKVLELPFGSDAEVSVLEDPTAFRFSAPTAELWDAVRAHAIEIHPGVMKVVIRDGEDDPDAVDEFELDRWRFRLPACTRPALATAVYAGGELTVTVPKGEEGEEEDYEERVDGISRISRLVLVL